MRKLSSFGFWVVLNIFVAFSGIAQGDSTKHGSIRKGGFYLLQDIRYQQITTINQRLEQANFAATKAWSVAYGAGGYGWFNRFKVGGEGYYFTTEHTKDETLTECIGFGGNAYVAYLLNPANRIQFSPLFGVGGESIKLLAHRTATVNDLAEVIATPQTLYIQTGSFYLQTALQAEWKTTKTVFGLSLVYHYAPSSDWQVYNSSLTTTVSDSLSAFLLKLSIGLE